MFLLFSITGNAQVSVNDREISRVAYLSLDGQRLGKANRLANNGNLHNVDKPLLLLLRTRSASPKGTILLIPGGGYETIRMKNEGQKAAAFLNQQNFDVALLEYHVGKTLAVRDSALLDALKAFRLLKSNRTNFGLRGRRLDIIGISSGGHLAARTVQKLNDGEQPDDVVLISPQYLDETSTGTVFPAVMPPVTPKARLFVSFSSNDNKDWIKSSDEYAKTWKGYDGQETFKLLPDSTYVSQYDSDPLADGLQLPGVLMDFLLSDPLVKNAGPNPAAVPVEGWSKKRHAEKLEAVAKEKFDLIMLGNSITNNFEHSEYRPVWNQFFAPRKAINLGFGGYRTEQILWNIQHGELDGQSPKVLVLEIGTNNIDEKHYPIRHTAGQLAGGIAAIVNTIRQKLPDTKIMILRCFPGSYDGPNPTSHRAILERASDIVSKLADGKHIFYCDVNHVFLNFDGSINHNLMPDYLHPSPAGAKLWARAMEPLMSELMGDKSLDNDTVSNTAIIPVSKLENDSYNWWDRHAEVLRVKDSINPEVVLIGNSITHFWGGLPQLKYADGNLREPNGPTSWASVFGPYRVLNLGFGWDRTQNVLWRLDHGELDGLQPRVVVIDIGTNNTTQTNNARNNTATEIVEGIREVCLRVRSKVPQAKIIVMAIFPRGKGPLNPLRTVINEVNRQLEVFTKDNKVTLVDIGPNLLAADRTFLPGMMLDYVHPTDKGYQVWADAIRPYISVP
ncbi:GDSL-type esterase/lipase family protein [Mucilaginibacter sp.]|uniref:GDSL-type esterase/lipase family protein n=1 Tax=Mucilaginibacter sp. TaxID=1882438 RepID=UPI003266B100